MSAEKPWVAETLYDNADYGVRMTYRVDEMLHEEQTGLQDLKFFWNKKFDKCLMLDGVMQITEADQPIYQEMMSHVPLFGHGSARRVLIVGGGDCAIAAQVLKHRGVEEVVQVEIDASVIERSKQFFPQFTTAAFGDLRFTSVIADGMKYVMETDERFDVIIVDSTDPEGPGEVLFSKEFYAACKRCMNPRGVMVTQNGVPFFQSDELRSTMRHFKEIFKHSGCYVAAIPSYVGGHMAMGWASNAFDLSRVSFETIMGRYQAVGNFETNYWYPDVQAAAFAVPRFIRKVVLEA